MISHAWQHSAGNVFVGLAVATLLGGGMTSLDAQNSGSATLTISASTAATAAAAPVRADTAGPSVGDMAPDFTVNGVTRYGLLSQPIKLSDFRGQTVVIAFFPGARTPGCTIQMEKYRDTYSTTFKNGQNVVVLGISVDADTTLESWASEAHFPMLFASDNQGTVGTLYGAYDTKYKLDRRLLYVVDPSGKIAYVAKPFNVQDAASFTKLADAIAKLQQ